MSQMYNICVALIFAIIVVGQRAEATTNELTTNRKEGSCQNEKSLVNICKHQYTVSEGCAKKLFKTIFNEDSDVHNVGSNCCKQLFHKEENTKMVSKNLGCKNKDERNPAHRVDVLIPEVIQRLT
ncbi:hypothetical protein ACFE04_004383 [Oxalis oulophora]